MNSDEIQERVTAANQAIAARKAQEMILYYGRVVPGWWKQLKEVLDDSCWEHGDLDEFCKRVFGCPEAEMQAFLKGEWRDYQPKFQEAAKVVFKPILDRQEKEKLEDEADAKTRKALRQARWRAKKKEKP